MEQRNTLKDFWWLISDQGKTTSKSLLRFMGVSFLGSLAVFILGFAFIPIYSALLFIVGMFFPYWQPAYTVFIKVADLNSAPKKLERPLVPRYLYIGLFVLSIFILFKFFIGITLLVKYGFCGQNLFCMLLTTDH